VAVEKSTKLQELQLRKLKETQQTQQLAPSEILWRWVKRMLISDYFILALSIIGYIIAAYFFDRLRNPINIVNQLSNMWPLFAVAIGQTFVLIIAGIDLSVGSTMALTSVIGAMIMSGALNPDMFDKLPLWGSIINENGGLLSGSEWAMPVAVIVMLAVGVLIGFINGTLITRFNITPFIATLVTLTFFSYFALWLTQSRNISGLPESFVRLGDDGQLVSIYLGQKVDSEIRRRDIPTLITSATVIAVGLGVVANLILTRTAFGRRMFAIGTNSRAAVISGVSSARITTLVYMFSGFCAATASIIYTARLEIGRPTLGEGSLLMDIIGACVIGGSSLFGGKGTIKGTFFGVVFFTLLLNILNAARLSPFVIEAVKGAVILGAALLDITRTRLLNQEQTT
jgi:ribose/xylose/arabinose/galactoside ABC-type transport system permease subunit